MEENKELRKLYTTFQFAIYFSLCLEFYLFFYVASYHKQFTIFPEIINSINYALLRLPFFHSIISSKISTLILICIVSIGTQPKKDTMLNPKRQILLPLIIGLFLIGFAIWSYHSVWNLSLMNLDLSSWSYLFSSILGTILIHISMDNISKIIHSNYGKDKWNIEQESFEQPNHPVDGPYTINIPMLYYFKRKVHAGYITLENLFRGVLVCGVPGSGKSFGIIMPIIREMIHKSFTMCLYDLKYPDLAKIAYYNYHKAQHEGKCKGYDFHVINLNEPEKSRRVNPFNPKYIKNLAEALETAEALVEALKKGDKSSGSTQFFTQSAINFLASCIYFFAKHENGKYSTLPHILAFINLSYEEIFEVLFTNPELSSLLSPFLSAYKAKAFDQLEGQIGTLRVFISRMATKETFWVFSADDFDLHISSKNSPAIMILANDPSTQSTNSVCLSIVLNRVTKLINTKGNLPIGLIADEAPSIYIHKIDVLIAQARSNLSAVVLGLQELPMLRQQYGRESADTITAIMGNIISGAVRSKDTLDWLEKLFGKVKQKGESLNIDRNKTAVTLNEKLDSLIPAGKIASLSTGEIVGILAKDNTQKFTGEFNTTAINCKVNLNLEEIKIEEKNYLELPEFYDFQGKKKEILMDNYNKITQQVNDIVLEIIHNKNNV